MFPTVDLDASSVNVDLADPESIARQVPKIQGIVAEKRAAAAKAQEEFDTWNALLNRLRTLASLNIHFVEPDGDDESSWPSIEAQDAVVKVVEREDRPILPLGVNRALRAEGHEVQSLRAVRQVLVAAAAAGRLQRRDDDVAPLSLDLTKWEDIPAMQTVPEAHLGLDGPPPKSKSEGAIRVLGTEPSRPWTTPDIAEVMATQGWIEDHDGDLASLASTLSRLVTEGKIFRPARGRYQLAPPGESDDRE